MDKKIKKNLCEGQYYYFPQQIIGEGGYAKVYRGQKTATKEPVAIKRISLGSQKNMVDKIYDDYAYAAINTEIRILKHIKDEHIIKSQSIVRSKTGIYLILEYADGGNFQQFLYHHKNLQEKKIIKYITQIVCGMGVLVKNGITHRDLKPANILIAKGKLKLADFGLSRFSQISQKMISKVGTSTYMAPQILCHNPYTSKCDIWSLGVICYEMVTGFIPWTSERKNSISEHIMKVQKFVSDGILFPANCIISEELKGFIRGCLQYEENKRFGWIEVFLHKIFKGKFRNAIFKEENFTPKFCLSRLRHSIHLQNINIEELFTDIPQQMDLPQFKIITKVLDSEIVEQEAQDLYKQILGAQEKLQKIQFMELLQKNGVNLKGKKLSSLQKISGKLNDSKNLTKILDDLSKKIQMKKLDLFQLFQQKNSSGLSSISPESFNEIILKIDPEIPQQFFPDLLQVFDVNKDGKISYEQLYTQFCRIAQMAVIRDKNMMDSFRKMVMTKNKRPFDLIVKSCK